MTARMFAMMRRRTSSGRFVKTGKALRTAATASSTVSNTPIAPAGMLPA